MENKTLKTRAEMDASSSKIGNDVEAFLAMGGEITQIQQGITQSAKMDTKKRQALAFKKYKKETDNE